MAWRQLPDGSYFNPNTGDLHGLDGAKEEAARMQSMRAGHLKPRPRPLPRVNAKTKFPPLPLQRFVALPGIRGPEVIIDPVSKLALNPYELGMGMFETMGTTTKRVIVAGGIVAAVGGACWLLRKTSWFGGKKKSK